MIYTPGQLQVTNSSDLRTLVFVHPDGLNLPPNWLYETATNRTRYGVEVVILYFGGLPASLGVFDWSCTVEFPCGNGATAPSWQWIVPLNELLCYVHDDPGLPSAKGLFYSNQTKMADRGKPRQGILPLWVNKVRVWNYCEDNYNTLYTHRYRVEQPDCSNNSCAWWGPILETFFPYPQPAILPLGFAETRLILNGKKYLLTEEVTDCIPPLPPWQEVFREPNHSWLVGSD